MKICNRCSIKIFDDVTKRINICILLVFEYRIIFSLTECPPKRVIECRIRILELDFGGDFEIERSIGVGFVVCEWS